jgi:hypothetical protein
MRFGTFCLVDRDNRSDDTWKLWLVPSSTAKRRQLTHAESIDQATDDQLGEMPGEDLQQSTH